METPLPELSDIQRFYKNTTVFLTGATGFIGKLFLEKVLRALPVKKVFVLVRSKKDDSALQRLQNVFESPIFDGLKRSNPDVFDKVVIMEGDCDLRVLGLSEQDIETFIKEVNVIFHCAANVKFQDPIQKATKTNVRATKDLVDLARIVKTLKAFVYVGTVFSNSNRFEIKEEVYPVKITAEKLIAVCEILDEECADKMTDVLIHDWPNTYTFTKQVAEEYIQRVGRDIPICIARPAIVTSTAVEPVTAFVDNMFTLAGFVVGNAMGIIRITFYRNTNLDLVPADYVVNECIAAGWHTGETFKKGRTETPVYNISSVVENPIKQDDVYDMCDYYGRQVPSPKQPSYPLYFRTTCKYNYLFFRFFFHTMVAYVIDLVGKIRGKNQNYVRGIQKLHKFQEAFEHFTTNDFFVHVENTQRLLKHMTFQDKELFNFDIRTINWQTYFSQYPKGLRFYLIKEPMDTLPEGVKSYRYNKRVLIATLVFLAILLYALGKIFVFRVLPLVFGIVTQFIRGLVC